MVFDRIKYQRNIAFPQGSKEYDHLMSYRDKFIKEQREIRIKVLKKLGYKDEDDINKKLKGYLPY